MSEREVRIARKWYSKGVPADHIGERLDRSKTSVWDKIGAEDHDGIWGVGRKAFLSAADTDKLVVFTKSIFKKAKVRYTVTAEMIQAKFTPKACRRMLRNVLHERKNMVSQAAPQPLSYKRRR